MMLFQHAVFCAEDAHEYVLRRWGSSAELVSPVGVALRAIWRC